MGDFDELISDVSDGINGRNAGLPMGFKRLNNYISLRKSNIYLLGGFTGCIAGDTIIEIARKQRTANTNRYTIAEVFNKLHGHKLRDKWNLRLPTRIKVYMPDKGQTSVHYIEDVVYSGPKWVYEVVTETGKRIKATGDHKFMINEEGDFKRLSLLSVGDFILCKALKESRARGRKVSHRDEICRKMPYYHTAKKRRISGHYYERVYTYRVAYDAYANNLSEDEFLLEVSSNQDHRLILSDPRMIIHHEDENPLNNHPSNLKLITKKEHDTLHAKTSNFGNSWVQLERIASIESIGEEDTYDVICKDPYHNFIANGFVVHNSGKTSLVDDAFVLNPVDWYLRNKRTSNIEIEIIYWSMERPKNFKLMKWISRKIFLDHGLVIPVSRLMGWCPPSDRLTSDEHDIFLTYRDYIEAMLEIVKIIGYPENPTGIRNFMKEEVFMKQGEIEVVSNYKKIYHPHKPNKIILQIKDHAGLIRKEKNLNTKKEIIDKASEDDRYFRDFFGGSSAIISQFNRDISNPMRLKNGDVEPMLEDFKETSNTQEDADVVLSLFDPMRYKVPDPSGYDLSKLKDGKGTKKYRSLKILKNSYGSDDIRIGLAFQPEVGTFKEMPKLADMTADTYASIDDNSFFFPDR